MKLGIENKKQVIWLGALVLVLAYVFYANVIASDSDLPASARQARPAATTPNPIPGAGQVPAETRPVESAQVRPRPPVRGPRGGMQFKVTGTARNIDPASIDPTLRLDLLAKVQSVTLQGGERNLFQFGAAPLPKTPEPKIIPKPAVPVPAPAATPAEPVKPPPPPIPLKFFGYSQARPGEKRAFFLDGEDIIVATEGETIKRRYRVVRIGLTSVVVEDTEHKNQQTLPLEPEQVG